MRVPADTIAAIRAHAASVYPDECCGALIGQESRPSPSASARLAGATDLPSGRGGGGRVIEAFALPNTTSGERRRRFLIGPEEYRAAEARASEIGSDVIGFYHSHPDHPAIPSAFDLEHAWPNLSYVIVSVRAGRPEEARSWRLRGDRSAFDEEALVVESAG